MPSFGSSSARQSIATYSSRPGSEVTADDVIIASGCSGALDLVITCLVNEGDNILVPKPGFPLYEVITKSLGGDVKHYPLLVSSRLGRYSVATGFIISFL
jgi:tyrosine aminotransferase